MGFAFLPITAPASPINNIWNTGMAEEKIIPVSIMVKDCEVALDSPSRDYICQAYHTKANVTNMAIRQQRDII
jgi:hypothetical protein